MSPVGKVNVSLTILVVLTPEDWKKIFIDFSNNKFLIETGSINLFHYIWKLDLFIKMFNFNDSLEIYLEGSYAVPHTCKVS